MYDEFKAEIAENIARTLRSLRKGGTFAMGLANLMQVTPTPYRAEGPRGTNSAYVYRAMFAEVVANNPHFTKFTTVETGGAR